MICDKNKISLRAEHPLFMFFSPFHDTHVLWMAIVFAIHTNCALNILCIMFFYSFGLCWPLMYVLAYLHFVDFTIRNHKHISKSDPPFRVITLHNKYHIIGWKYDLSKCILFYYELLYCHIFHCSGLSAYANLTHTKGQYKMCKCGIQTQKHQNSPPHFWLLLCSSYSFSSSNAYHC